MENVVILGSTGSIGVNTLDVLRNNKERFRVYGLAGRSNLKELKNQVERFLPAYVVIWDAERAKAFRNMITTDTKILSGIDGLKQLVSDPKVHVVVNALVGAVGLLPTVTALQNGKKVALANKETMVIGGKIINEIIGDNHNMLMPIDSEHSALHQCINGASLELVEKIIITASGGPFLNKNKDGLRGVTPAQALKHPNWEMGSKITIDSATLMNKGLEVIEAHFLFHIPYEQIDVVVHPESIIHSMVQYKDGSILAQLGTADMRIPIQYALSFPGRWQLSAERIDFAKAGSLTFREPDTEKFPCLALAYEAGRAGGSIATVMNAANEVAVEQFLEEKISFNQIPEIIEAAMNRHKQLENPTIDDIIAIDREVREIIKNGDNT